MTRMRTLTLALSVLLAATAADAAGPRATAANVRQAQDLQRRLDTLTRQQRDLARQLRDIDVRLSRGAAGSERLLLETQRQAMLERQYALESDRAAAEASLAALPEAAKAAPRSATGPIGPFDPQGLQPFDVWGNSGQVSNPRAFNPAISVIPDVVFFRDNKKGGSSNWSSRRTASTGRTPKQATNTAGW